MLYCLGKPFKSNGESKNVFSGPFLFPAFTSSSPCHSVAVLLSGTWQKWQYISLILVCKKPCGFHLGPVCIFSDYFHEEKLAAKYEQPHGKAKKKKKKSLLSVATSVSLEWYPIQPSDDRISSDSLTATSSRWWVGNTQIPESWTCL